MTSANRHRQGIGIEKVLFDGFGLFIDEGEDRKREEVGGSGTQRGKASKKANSGFAPFLTPFFRCGPGFAAY